MSPAGAAVSATAESFRERTGNTVLTMAVKVVLHTFHIKPVSPVAFILILKMLFSLGKKKILVLIVTNPSIGGPGGEEVTWPPGAVNDRVGAGSPHSEFGLFVGSLPHVWALSEAGLTAPGRRPASPCRRVKMQTGFWGALLTGAS